MLTQIAKKFIFSYRKRGLGIHEHWLLAGILNYINQLILSYPKNISILFSFLPARVKMTPLWFSAKILFAFLTLYIPANFSA